MIKTVLHTIYITTCLLAAPISSFAYNEILVGGSVKNGDFNANPGASINFAQTTNWYNLTSAQTNECTKSDLTYDGTPNAVLTSNKTFAVDTGHTIAEGLIYDISYVWRDAWNWLDGSDQVMVSLFVTSDNTIDGTRSNLVVDASGTSIQSSTYEAVDHDAVYTADSSVTGMILFAAIETESPGFGRLDNFELIAKTQPTGAIYTVTYIGNGSTGGSVPVDTNLYAASNTVTVLSNTGSLVNADFPFDTWNTAANGSGTDYTSGNEFTMPDSDVVLYAQWEGAPTWSEEFNGSGPPDPDFWWFEIGYKRNNEFQWYTTNAWQESGKLVIEGRRESTNGYEYTSASLRTSGKYSWQYGRAQIRAKIPCQPGMWPAIWMVGDTGEWASNGECDILEYKGTSTPKIFANCARGTTTRWTAAWDDETTNVADLVAVDPDWETKYHIWSIQWDEEYVRLYVDNILMNTTPQSWLVNPVTTWGPLEPFKQPHSLWLNLAIGGDGGGDPSGTTFPQRYYIDYWKVWEGATNNTAPTDISISSDIITDQKPAGTMVGYLTATDPDLGEVIRYELVSGTGDDDNSLFSIPKFISDNTTTGVLETAAILSYADASNRSVRVRATDIAGAMYEEVLTINILDPTDPDQDLDGMSDSWETNHFGNAGGSDGTGDEDGDGFIDLHEYLAGTDPTNSTSLLALTDLQHGVMSNEFLLTWQAVSNKSYMLLSTDDIMSPDWITNAINIPGIEPMCVYTVQTSGAKSFYLLRLQE